MLYKTGSILNSIKVAKLQAEWEAKSNKLMKQQNEILTPEERMLRQYEEDFRKMKERARINEIYSKLASGASLSAEELDYLRKNDPDAAAEYERSRNEQEAYKRELRNCKTKEEAERLKQNKMGCYVAEAKSIANNPVIPKGMKMAMMQRLLGKATGINKAHAEFTRTAGYANLPTEAELREAEAHKTEAESADKTVEAIVPESDDEEQTTENSDTQTGDSDAENADFADVKEIVENYFADNRTTGSGEPVLEKPEESESGKENN